MAAEILDGRQVAAEVRAAIRQGVRESLARSRRAPGLGVVLVGDDPASEVYVRMKLKACREVGLRSTEVRLAADASTADVLREVTRLNQDPSVDGILVQMPLPPQVDRLRVLAAILPAKDADGLHPVSLGHLAQGQDGPVPCTPRGIMELLAHYDIPVKGSRVTIVGRSHLVGMPLALLMLASNATVTVAHSRTRDLTAATREADILVAAVGRPGLIVPSQVKPGSVVVDVGVNRTAAGLVGDVDPKVAEVAAWISPVPGGVGPMTVAMLLKNTWEAYQRAG